MPWDAAHDSYRPAYDDPLKDAAARFLFADMDPTPRVRGLETVEQCRAWLQVESDRDDPRQAVVAEINKRIRVLQDAEAESAESTTEVSA